MFTPTSRPIWTIRDVSGLPTSLPLKVFRRRKKHILDNFSFIRKTANSRVEAPFRELGVMYRLHLELIGKLAVDSQLNFISLMF